MGPADSIQVSRDWTYSGTFREATRFSPTGLSPSMVDLSMSYRLIGGFVTLIRKALQPPEENPQGLGYSAFARRY